MLFTASTVLDAPENVRRFVASNLAMGVDHMVVFLDDPAAPGQAEVAADLAEHPHVTCVGANEAWWLGKRPRQLNVRQRIHANLVLALVEPVPEAEWVVHVDGDEVAVVDRDALASVPRGLDAVRLSPLEAVSRYHAEAPPTLFKSLLDDDDLTLLHVLGVLDAPSNRSYFHGHVKGKSGVRARSGLRLTLHDVVDVSGRQLPAEQQHGAPGLEVLHYDAISGEEFVHKWRRMIAAGVVSLRPDREPLMRALRALEGKDLDAGVVDAHLRRLYELTTQDDVETLDGLGLLVRVDPRAGTHSPADLPAGSRERLAARLADLRRLPKQPFHANLGGGTGRGGAAGADGGAAPASRPVGDDEGVLGRLRRTLPRRG